MDMTDKSGTADWGLIRMPPTIELRDVRFRYGTDSFEIAAGSMSFGPGQIAIVGKADPAKPPCRISWPGCLRQRREKYW